MSLPIILIGLLVIVGLYLLSLYNGLVSSKLGVDESWSGIDVQLKRRSSLIPNLVETVKGYAAHESGVFEKVTEARSALMSATTPNDAAVANNQLTGALKSLFAVAEAYPELKANANFQQLQNDLNDTEDKVAYSRQFYNSNVMNFNTKIKVFPAVLIAGSMGFKEYAFFKADDSEKADIAVKF
ncbi:MAG: LemA family protein [candidate division WWE3 bacterium]|nr:LemA family protein [candidate division WWE3 bacterium]